MTDSVTTIEAILRIITDTVLANETYFSDLDAVVGDGDFGYSLARGFEILDQDWANLDRTDAGTFLQKAAMTISSRVGGTSGPIWGTAMLRAASTLKKAETIDGAVAVECLRAAIEGIKARGGADVGEKTLLDALVPMTDTIEEQTKAGADRATVLSAAAGTAREAAEATKELQAMRGRASYTGERSIGSVDPGAIAVAVIVEQLAQHWN